MPPRAAAPPNLSLLTTDADSAVTRLHRYVARRADLRASFQQAWRQLEAGPVGAWQERWAEAALRLFEVNAGPACQIAFWQLSRRHAADGEPAALEAVADAAGGICRRCGAGGARAFLERAGLLLARNPTAREIAPWLQGHVLLVGGGEDALAAVLERLDLLLAGVRGPAFLRWVETGLAVGAGDRQRLLAWFTLEDPLSRRLLQPEGALAGLERPLQIYLHGLTGLPLRLRALPPPQPQAPPQRSAWSGRLVLLPERFADRGGRPVLDGGGPAAGGNAVWFAAAAHIAAHIAHTPARFEPGSLKPVQIALVSLVEDARVEHLAMRRLPGLRRLWAPFHTIRPDTARTMPNLLARLARALFDPDHDDPEPWVQRGRAMLAERMDRIGDPAIAREIGNLLGNDLGQMRVPTLARTHVVEPVYRDDNSGLWNLPPPEDAPQLAALAIDTVRLEREERDEGRTEPDPDPAPEQAGRVRPAQAPPDPDGAPVARYPEWDHRARIARPDWTVVRDAPAPAAPAAVAQAAAEAHGDLTRRIEALVRSARVGQPMRRKRQPDGEQLDMDAAVEAMIALRSGETPDRRVYQVRTRRARDLSLLLLLDGSASTADRLAGGKGGGPEVAQAGRPVVAVERDAALILARAMDHLNDPLAVRSFDSNGREKVRIRRLKDFDEPFDQAAAARIAWLQPGLSTRLGAAIRHSGRELSQRRSWRRLLVVVTDGEPSDIDVPDRRYLIEDARHAVQGLRAAGIDVFALGLDSAATGYGPEIFGRHHYLPIRRLEALPERLAMLYFRLVSR